MNINYNKANRSITITETYGATVSPIPVFNKSGDTYALSFINLEGVKYFNSFTYEVTGTNENRYITTEYRISKDGELYSDWFPLDNVFSNFPPFDPKYKMFLEVKWTRKGDSNIGAIKLLCYNIGGAYDQYVVVNDFSGQNKSIVVENTNFSVPVSVATPPVNNLAIVIGTNSSLQGPQGPQGLQGMVGPTGPQGYQGTKGIIGPQGPQGLNGIIGVDGATGPQGPQGLNGIIGVNGATGPQGADGPQGPQGEYIIYSIDGGSSNSTEPVALTIDGGTASSGF